MHILFLTPQVPYPPRQGTSIRNFNLIARMAQNHTVDLLTFLAPGDSLPPSSPLHSLCRRIKAVPQPDRGMSARLRSTLMSTLPDMALRLESSEMHRCVQAWRLDGGYKIVQIEGIEMAQYARHIDQSDCTVIFDDHNCEYLLQQRNALTDLQNPRRWHAAAYSLIQWAKLRRYEATVCHSAQAVIAVSQPDQAALLQIAPQANIVVAPNGIDLAAYERRQEPNFIRDTGRFTLLFVGKMDYRPNIDAVLWFAQEVLPSLVAAAPEIHFQIVGMNPHARLDVLRRHPNIEITGMVADPIPYLQTANVFIIPMRVGGGTRFKALEAMAASQAIVSTTLGVEGIGVTGEEEMLLADTPDEFAVAILRLLADQRADGALSQRLGQSAHRFVADNYTWEKIMPVLDQLYNQVQPDQPTATPRRPLPATNRAHHNQTGVKS